MRSALKKILLSAVLLLMASRVFAQEATETSSSFFVRENTGIIIILGLVICIVVWLKVLVSDFARHVRKQMINDGEKVPFIINVFGILDGDWRSMTGEYNDVVLEHHDYDGIQEYDNDLPPWWKYMFYVTIVFGVFYMGYFHFWGGPSSAEEYQAEVVKAELLYADIDLTYDGPIEDKAELVDAERSFKKTCQACHGEFGEGKVGPNLTDAYWIHGGDINSVYYTIKYGVPEKGMESWKDEFSNEEIYKLASYISSLQGSNPANAKEAQGELYEPEVLEEE